MLKSEIVKTWAYQQIGCPYIMGGVGADCTPDYRRARMAQYPDYAEKIKRNCPRLSGGATDCTACKWANPETGKGRPAYDCAQLVRRGFEQVGIKLISGANSQWKQQYVWAIKGSIDQIPYNKVCALYKRDGNRMVHAGLYLGDGLVAHAKGHDYGVVLQEYDRVGFTHYAIPQGLEDDIPMDSDLNKTLKPGDSGEYVRRLQMALMRAGYSLPRYGADGKFGAETAAALRAFQRVNALPVTGECDNITWALLMDGKHNNSPDVLFEALVNVRGLLVQAYDAINTALEIAGGGELSNG